MSNVTSASSSSLLNGYKKRATDSNQIKKALLKRNDTDRKQELDETTKKDAKVTIPDAIKDFSRIKKVVDSSPEIDKSEKIAALKAQIEAGEYKVDYDALAEKILDTEF